MDNYDFFNIFVTALAQSAAIETWAHTQFGKSLAVFADVTSGELPNADDMPYAIFHTPGVDKHQERRDQRYQLSVDVAVDKSSLAQRVETNMEQPAGIELILDIGSLVVDAVKAALPANTSMGYSLSADTLGALPEVYGYIDFEFITHVSLAGDPLG